ncbi:hypothetical protein CBS115989_5650 [Aspergillus niger]|uniref:Carbonic anhydrase n=3 Tax=Aspergillus niger TaxID=5061 RepID=A2R1V0_ASPNC|nr:uncharacterized protein An13g02530 [Aspergillus niger]RDH24334.1 carbonic anhydrase [Aspergillus niger ATCC 13496]KAI2817914.1 hypothetical protein CBS115989_5650 [Aspergillus niger]KAI2853422.1 hypothetical protein CBS11350_160 [Aspergillus niger]KAI2861410.1 hypothetical protein CBS11232_1046 [Aspergillus niger]KAI2875258.1 hypothetical protein CBS115988_5576 [Aspergillus niger]|eukprot:XP_001396389.1 hypothetical protein ANI_1_728114 [Aspergillus niger CBS 513.88]
MHLTSLLLLIPAVAASCFHNTPLARRATAPSFGYTATRGPLNWYGLDPNANAACATGTHQSPIMIGSTQISKVDNSTITLFIPTVSDLEFENLGTTIEVPLTNGTLVVRNNTYTLAQFHFHTPSEHRIDEEHFPMEAHFVFSDEDGNIAVVGYLIQLTSTKDHSTPLLNTIFEDVDEISEPGSSTELGLLDFSSVTRHFTNNDIYTYSGSLTTRPAPRV